MFQSFSYKRGIPVDADYGFDVRMLPNLEHPRTPIRRYADEPRAYCWATIPTDIGAHLQRAHDYKPFFVATSR